MREKPSERQKFDLFLPQLLRFFVKYERLLKQLFLCLNENTIKKKLPGFLPKAESRLC